MNILILGYGQIGQPLAQQLKQKGHQVTAISRTEKMEVAGICHLQQNICHLKLEKDQIFDWVYVILSPSQRGVEFYQQAFVDTVAPIYQALKNHPVQKIVFVSSTHVYGENQGQIVDDATLAKTSDPMGQVLIAAEQLHLAYWGEKLVIIRPSGLYQANSQYLVKQAITATNVNVKHWTNRIHRQDLIGFLEYLTQLLQAQSHYVLSDQQSEIQYVLWNKIRQAQGLAALEIAEHLPQTGKRIHAQHLQDSGYVLKYPTWKQGYQFDGLK